MGGGSSRQAAAPKAKPKAKTAANKKASEKPKPKAEVKAAPTKQRKNKKAKDEKLGEEPVELIAVAEVEDTTAEPEEPVEEQVVQETGDVIQDEEQADGDALAVEVKATLRMGEEGMQAEVQWAAAGASSKLSSMDMLYLVPSPLEGSWEDVGSSAQLGYVFPSGKQEGSVVMELAGLVEAGKAYEVHYVLGGVNEEQDLGKSDPFTPTRAQAPKLAAKKLAEAKEKSEKANSVSSLQHHRNDVMAQSDAVPWHPLLSITPADSTWKKLMEEAEERRSARAAGGEHRFEPDSDARSVGKGQKGKKKEGGGDEGSAVGKQVIETELEEEELRRRVLDAFDATPGFIYAGAGVSMAAPSCSPSWWRLMNDLLAETFARAPPEFEAAVAQMGEGDVSRQPEEIMESYYLVFKEHLFTLFGLLDKGAPNANHIGMAKLAKAGRLKAILTTNFDIFIERALDQEEVPYTVVVTAEEFEQYCKVGCKGIGVLKIHGTIERPDTIVAVSNHYKMGKGFGGWKATAAARLMKECPTLFLGYSGWDFQHKNYQEFWAEQGGMGGEGVFWLTLKAFKGGPDLHRLVGKHVGHRLQVGASSLPDFLLDLLSTWDERGRVMVARVEAEGGGAREGVERERVAFLKSWVAGLPEVPVLAVLLIEAATLNKTAQERMKRTKENAKTAEEMGDTNEMSAFFLQLSMDLSAGKITQQEYDEQLEGATLDITFVHLQLPKPTKQAVKVLVQQATKTEPFFLEGCSAAALKGMLPSLVLAAGEGAPYDATAEYVVGRAVEYIRNEIVPLQAEEDRRSRLLCDTMMYCSAVLKCRSKREEGRVKHMMQEFVDNGLKEEWDDEKFGTERYNTLQKNIDRTVTGYVDTGNVVDLQVEATLRSYKASKDVDSLLRDALSLALGLLRIVPSRTSELWDCKKLTDVSAKFFDESQKDQISTAEFWAVEAELALPKKLAGVKAALEAVKKKEKQRAPACSDALAALDLASSRLWLEVFPYMGQAYQLTQAREHKGYYPRANWPAPCVAFAKERLFRYVDPEAVTDERVLQPLLAGMAVVGEASEDFDLMRTACERSLALTEGKVTELTPAPIPECLAAAYEAKGEYGEAIAWFAKALDGLRTSVVRQKADAIVLNACLVQATADPHKALVWALTASPLFGGAQHFSLPGPARPLLAQQCEAWAGELGYASLAEAETALLAPA